ncbi:Swarming motility protein SwrC [Polaribacter huanghezhanensis]|uniref:efflux RND transporter permease subunit n=1 Tax=Polaribacter huanghezhanensis TaxID=1354726 RepID=UPI002649B520|nr:efflux RND transporter permease subunit [Polaribacter huanghezhanensis]WKD85066.1 Swarming motility protein SwrC [Polaribacter huanghezhanensis]
MKFSPFKVFILFIVLSFLGLSIVSKLSVRLNPSATLPSITVSYSWSSASPYSLEKEITAKLEGSFGIIKGVTNINSKSSKGNGYITLEFDKFTNISAARFEVATKIRQLYKKLPEKASYPTISVNSPEDSENERAFLSYSINAPYTSFAIQETVKNSIEPQISTLVGVDKINTYGAKPKEYVISYENSQLQKLFISKNEIITAIQQQFSKESLGEINYQSAFITLSLSAATKLSWHIPIKKVKNRIVYLDDIATIEITEQEASNYYRVNGKNAITFSVYATKNANTIVLAKQVAKKLQEIKLLIPKDYTITETYNATEYLEKELSKIYERASYTVIILLLFILLVSKSIRYLTITVLSLIANLSIAFLCYYLLEVEIQLYSLAGITISLGLIIDNSIVMIDHIKKLGNTNVIIPILASTLTTVGALSIIYFLDDKYKVNLIDFALVIIINLSVSLLVALFLIPALLKKIPLKETKPKKWGIVLQEKFYTTYSSILSFLIRFKKSSITIIILGFGIPFFLLPQKMEKNNTFFEKTYNTTLGNEWYRENVRPYLDTYLGGSFRLFNAYVFGDAYYGRNEETKLYVTASMEKGATVHQMNEAFLVIENYLNQFSEIKQFISSINSGNYARMEIAFKEEFKESSFPFVLKARLVRKALDLGGIDWRVYGVGNGFSNGGGSNDPINFSVEAKGYNYNNLNAWADTLKVALEKHPRIQNVLVKENTYYTRKPSYEYQFTLDKEKLAMANSNPSKVFNELKELTLSKSASISLNIDGTYMPIRFVSNNSNNYDIWAIKQTPIDSINNPIILNDIAEVTQLREEENIYKENQEYIRLVQFQYTGSAKFGAKFLDEKLKELHVKLPLGYQFEKAGNRWFLSDDKNNNYLFLLTLVLVIIYFICAILFESFKQPFIILSVIPISFIGVFLTFYLFDFNFDQGGLASFVLLSGITVNASIFIINGFNKLKKEHPNQNYSALYLEAFKQKIFPIILTIVSTILGFIPFVKDGQNEVFWFALGAGTIGGLLFSLLGILFYLPIFTLKKNLFGITLIAVIAIGSSFGFSIQNANANASETDTYCYSEQVVKIGAGYWKCQPSAPCVWIENRKGKGTQSLCTS